MNRAEFARHLNKRFSHVLQCQQRASEATTELARVETWHLRGASSASTVELEKARNAARATENNLAAAKAEFYDGLFDAVVMIALGEGRP